MVGVWGRGMFGKLRSKTYGFGMKEKISIVDEANTFVANGTKESQKLEFKSNRILGKDDIKLSKEIVGFANSTGGTILIGIEEEGAGVASYIEGSSRDWKDWIETVLNNKVSPQLNGVVIENEQSDTGWIYKITVPKSGRAPHQAGDQKYYRRSLTACNPLQHYEIEDIKFRSRIERDPVLVSLTVEQQSMFTLRVEGNSEITLENVVVDLSFDFKVPREIERFIKRVDGKKIRYLRKGDVHRYYLGQTFNVKIEGLEQQRLLVKLSFDWLDGRKSEVTEFEFNDFSGQVPRPEIGDSLEKISRALMQIQKQLTRR